MSTLLTSLLVVAIVLLLVVVQAVCGMAALYFFLVWCSKDRTDPLEGEYPDVD